MKNELDYRLSDVSCLGLDAHQELHLRRMGFNLVDDICKESREVLISKVKSPLQFYAIKKAIHRKNLVLDYETEYYRGISRRLLKGKEIFLEELDLGTFLNKKLGSYIGMIINWDDLVNIDIDELDKLGLREDSLYEVDFVIKLLNLNGQKRRVRRRDVK